MNALETRGLTRRFGGFVAVDAVDFSLTRGARHALIGPNGAGKTTFVNLLSGALAASGGTVALFGIDVSALPQHARARAGLVRTFQVNQLFPEFTPLEAVTLAVAEQAGAGAVWWRAMRADAALRAEAVAVLDGLRFPLADRTRPTAELPYGQQRLLEIALALAMRARKDSLVSSSPMFSFS